MKIYLLACSALVLTLLSCKPKPAGGLLAETYWKLTLIEDGTKEIPISDSIGITANFSATGVTGNSACNTYFADYEAEGTRLTIDEMGSTEMACDNLNLENIYFNLFTKSQAFTATDSELTIFSEGGLLHYDALTEQEITTFNYRTGYESLMSLFPPLAAEKDLHIYPILRVDRPGNYPYTGTRIEPGQYDYFDEQTAEVWNNSGGEVSAVGHIGDLYIARVPGRYVSSDIALFRQEGDELKRKETIAWAWCDEGWCNQQDAWLSDVNKDGQADVVQHYTLTDDSGVIQEERFTVLLQDESGNFNEDAAALGTIDKDAYRMARI